MRGQLLTLLVIAGITVLGSVPSRTEDTKIKRLQTGPRVGDATFTGPIKTPAELIELTPDGRHIVELYKAARFVVDVEGANESVKAQVDAALVVASETARLHATSTKSCLEGDLPRLDPIATKARAFSQALLRVDLELEKSLGLMRQTVGTTLAGSARAKEDVNRYALAVHEFGRLRVQAQEGAKAIEGLAVSMRSAAFACKAQPIPPLFADRGAVSGLESAASRAQRVPPTRALKRSAITTFQF